MYFIRNLFSKCLFLNKIKNRYSLVTNIKLKIINKISFKYQNQLPSIDVTAIDCIVLYDIFIVIITF